MLEHCRREEESGVAEYKGKCGTTDAVISDQNRRVHIWVDVENKGECPIKIRFFKTGTVWIPVGVLIPGIWPGGVFITEHVRELTKTVQPGDRGTADRDEVNRVTISCAGEAEDGEAKNCRFTYSIRID